MKKFLIFILVVMVILLSGYIVYDKVIVVNNNQPNSSNKNTSDNSTSSTDTATTSTITGEENVDCSYKNEFGDGTQSITIKNAIQCKSGQGFAGASSHVYYLNTEHVFYHLSLVDLSVTELAKGIDKFEINMNGDVIAYYNSNYSKTNANQYVIYKNS